MSTGPHSDRTPDSRCCSATMQSVVTGQAPITLKWKNTSGGKQIKQKIILVHTITEKKQVRMFLSRSSRLFIACFSHGGGSIPNSNQPL